MKKGLLAKRTIALVLAATMIATIYPVGIGAFEIVGDYVIGTGGNAIPAGVTSPPALVFEPQSAILPPLQTQAGREAVLHLRDMELTSGTWIGSVPGLFPAAASSEEVEVIEGGIIRVNVPDVYAWDHWRGVEILPYGYARNSYPHSPNVQYPLRPAEETVSIHPGDVIEVLVSNPASIANTIRIDAGSDVSPDTIVASQLVPPGEQRVVSFTVTQDILNRVSDDMSEWRHNHLRIRGNQNNVTWYIQDILIHRSLPPGYLPPPSPPVFSQNAGFFSEPFYLLLTSESGTVIRYTTDGSIPTASSPVFESAIWVNSPYPTPENSPMSVRGVGRYVYRWAFGLPVRSPHDFMPELYYNGMVVRARTFCEYGVASETVTRSFFVDRDGRGQFNTQVMSISVEPEYWASETTGLYNNWWRPGWPGTPVREQTRQIVYVEMFCPDGNIMHSQNAQAWVFGNWSRGEAKRSLRFNFNQGDGDVRNLPQFIPNTRRNFYAPTEHVSRFRHINARISDPHETQIRDSVVNLMSEPLRPTIQNSVYGAIFVNGEFWGMYCLRTHRHAALIGEMYGVPRDSVYLTDNTWTLYNFINFADYPSRNVPRNLSVQSNFEYLSTRIDMDNFIDYILIGYHFDNWDWINNNFELWRTTEYLPGVYGGDMRWRFVIQDFDNGINYPNNDMMAWLNARAGMDSGPILQPWGSSNLRSDWAASAFINLFQNAEFRNTFAARYSTYTGTVFHPSRANAILDKMVAERISTIGRDMYRWRFRGAQTPTDGTERWLNCHGLGGWGYRCCIECMRGILSRRTDYSIFHIREYFNRTGSITPWLFPGNLQGTRPGLGLDTSGLTNIRWMTDSERGFFDIAGAQIRADLFDRGNLNDYDFCVSDFNANYIRGLPIAVTARAYEGYEFSHFVITGYEGVAGTFFENPINITPQPYTATPITVSAVFVAETLHSVTILDGGEGYSANPNQAAQGMTITLRAGDSPTRQRFLNWTSQDVIITNATRKNDATFTMPNHNVTVTAIWEDIPSGEDIVLMELRRTQTNATATNNRFNATGGLFQGISHLTAWSSGVQRNIGFDGTDRAPIVMNNLAPGWRSVNPSAEPDDLDYGITVDTATAFQIRFSTARHDNIRFSARQRSTGSGPDFFALAYRIGSEGGFTSIPGTLNYISLQNTFGYRDNNYSDFDWQHSQTFDQFSLPATMANQRVVYLRVYMRYSEIESTTASRVNGNTSINNIVIIGDADPHSTCSVCAEQCVLGDINGDGRVTSLDVSWLARWIIHEPVEICLYAADFFGDGRIFPGHITLLARWLVGHDVVLDNR